MSYRSRIFRSLCVIVLLSGGCTLNEDLDYGELTSVSFINALPSSEGVAVFIGQSQVNVDGEKFRYKDILPYRNVYPGDRVVTVADRKSKKSLLVKNAFFERGKVYSLFIIGNEKVDILKTEDNIVRPVEGKAKIRFINLIPDSKPIRLKENNNRHTFNYSLPYKSVTNFEEIDVLKGYEFGLSDHAEMEFLEIDIHPKSREVYSILIFGNLKDDAGEGNEISYGIIHH